MTSYVTFAAEEIMVDIPEGPSKTPQTTETGTIIFFLDGFLDEMAQAHVNRVLRHAGLHPEHAFDIPELAKEFGVGPDAITQVWKKRLDAFFRTDRYIPWKKVLVFSLDGQHLRAPHYNPLERVIANGHKIPLELIDAEATNIALVNNIGTTIEGGTYSVPPHGILFLLLSRAETISANREINVGQRLNAFLGKRPMPPTLPIRPVAETATAIPASPLRPPRPEGLARPPSVKSFPSTATTRPATPEGIRRPARTDHPPPSVLTEGRPEVSGAYAEAPAEMPKVQLPKPIIPPSSGRPKSVGGYSQARSVPQAGVGKIERIPVPVVSTKRPDSWPPTAGPSHPPPSLSGTIAKQSDQDAEPQQEAVGSSPAASPAPPPPTRKDPRREDD